MRILTQAEQWPTQSAGHLSIPVEELNSYRWQPVVVNPALVEDIKTRGVLRPVTIEHDSKGHAIMSSGHHRLDAAISAGLTHIPVELEEDIALSAYGVAKPMGPTLKQYLAGGGDPGKSNREYIRQYNPDLYRAMVGAKRKRAEQWPDRVMMAVNGDSGQSGALRESLRKNY